MTAPTQKPDGGGALRVVSLAASACIAFGVVAVALLHMLPAPHSRADYMIAGTLGTLAALAVVFAGLALGSRRP